MSIRPSRTTRTNGVVRALEGNTPLLLDDPAAVWVVETGRVDVFAVTIETGIATGARHYVCSIDPGDALFGLDQAAVGGDLGLLAVGVVGTRVAKTTMATLGANALEAAELDSVIRIVDEWVSGLASGVAGGSPPRTDLQLGPHDTCVMQAGQSARPKEGVVWVHLTAGELLFLGTDPLAAEIPEVPFPLAEIAWIQASTPASMTTTPTANAVVDDATWRGLASYHRLIMRALARRLEAQTAADADRVRRELEHDEVVRRQALVELSSVLHPLALTEPAEPDGDPLFAACRLVLKALGVEARRPPHQDTSAWREPLAEIAKASRVRLRQVALDHDWWQSDSGPMVGYTADAGRPVALLPVSSRQYELVDPTVGARTRVDRTTAQRLASDAWQFYRPFPDRPLKGRDLFAFGFRGSRRDFFRVALMGLAAGLLALLPPLATSAVFGTIIPNSENGRLLELAIALILCAVAIALFQIAQSVAITRIEARIDASVEPALWDRLLRLPAAFFREYSAGNLASRAMGIDSARQILTGSVLTSILTSIFSVTSFALLFYYSMELAIVALFFTFVAVLVTLGATWLELRYQRRLTDIQNNISGMVLQFLTGISKLRVAGAEDRAFGTWANLFTQNKTEEVKAQQVTNALSVFSTTWPVIGTMALFAFVIQSGSAIISTAALLAFLVAYSQFMAAALMSATAVSSVLQCVPLYEQARPILRALPEVDISKADPGVLSGAIEISHVSFRYRSDTPLVLHDVSLHIEPGEFVALVGPSGAGKSSLFRLLLGFDTPESGSIYFDGRDLSGLDIEAVRRQMGVVTQDSKILPGPIYTNILGTSLLTIDDAWDAARLAAIDEDIRAMPMGMHTMISEGGTTFSGGQLQRLMIARAVVRQPRILLFDEATSALDNESQEKVSQSLDHLQATRIVIAHRLSTIEHADRIFVFEAGRIVQTGSYQELIATPGPFANQAQRQLA